MVAGDDGQGQGDKPAAAGASTPRRLQVSALLAGAREVILEHDGQDYRLRITANGKLILTK
jgi:hemin uptake protein HemP